MKKQIRKRNPALAIILALITGYSASGQEVEFPLSKTNVSPDYQLVFPQDKVNTIEIIMTKDTWKHVNSDMKTKYRSDFGSSDRGPFSEKPADFPPNDPAGPFRKDRVKPGGADMRSGGGPPHFASEDPAYVAVSILFNGQKEIAQTGFRLKGNSSLATIWRTGSHKLPFRLKFNQFSDSTLPAKNRSFHGFKELSFSPGFHDNSLIREKVASDLFRAAGIPAAQTAFYKVYIDFGEGKKYCGVYTAVEVVDDTMIKTQFGEDKGNIYKPESTFHYFSAAQFEKKNNKKTADWSDVKAAIEALNDSSRITSPAKWRSRLEEVFNVNEFLKWLAINTTITSWDSYGAMAHNHYLYNSPTQKLTWIPWDLNESLQARDTNGPPGNRQPLPSFSSSDRPVPPPGSGGKADFASFGPPGRPASVDLSLQKVGAEWPLIRYLADDPVYFEIYQKHVKEFTKNHFTISKMNDILKKYTLLIQPYVTGAEPEQEGYTNLSNKDAFATELAALNKLVVARNKAVSEFLKKSTPSRK